MFRRIYAEDFPPFGEFHFAIPEVENKPDHLAEVHFLTGVNGTGKTRILSVLAAFLGEPKHLKTRLKSGIINKNIHIWCDISHQNKREAHLSPVLEANQGDVTLCNPSILTDNLSNVPAFAYNGNAYVSDANVSVLAPVDAPSRADCLSFVRFPDKSLILLQAIANLKIQSAMDFIDETPRTDRSGRSAQIIQSLESTISSITGQKFKFFMTTYPAIKLFVKWQERDLPFDVLPDGLRSIIGWLAHAVVMMDVLLEGKDDPTQTEAVFLLDEIESSLHPTWQRRILPAFQRLFPKSQIFVATHSPFMIASLNHGWIHQLTLNQDGTVKVEEPKAASTGDSYVTVVEEIMGLKEWFDPETENLLTDFRESRDKGFAGDAVALSKARDLANTISKRSVELQYMMGREISQMDRHGAGTPNQ